MAVEISKHQFSICQAANRQFCNMHTPLQLLANPPSYIAALYAKKAASISNRCLLQIRKTQSISLPSQITPKMWILTSAPSTVTTAITLICPGETTKFITVKKPIHVLWLPPACSATSPHFHLPPHYEHPALTVNISLDMANLNMVNISSLDFHIWQHLKHHRNDTQLHHFSRIPSVSIAQLYKHMISGIKPITPFTSPTESIDDTESIWMLFSHTRVYVTAVGLLIPTGLGIFCCYFFWCWPVRLPCWPLQPGSMWYTIVDDDVEEAPIYRCNSKAKQPTKPHGSHDLYREWEPTQMKSWQKQQMQSLGVPVCGPLGNTSKIQGIW